MAQPKPFKCPFCPKRLPSERSLIAHIHYHGREYMRQYLMKKYGDLISYIVKRGEVYKRELRERFPHLNIDAALTLLINYHILKMKVYRYYPLKRIIKGGREVKWYYWTVIPSPDLPPPD